MPRPLHELLLPLPLPACSALCHADINGNPNLMLAAHDAGEAAVIQYGSKIPPYAETRSYAPRVLQHHDRYCAIGKGSISNKNHQQD